MEVSDVELSGRLQPRPILNHDAPAFHCDETVCPELLQRSVYMDCREAGGWQRSNIFISLAHVFFFNSCMNSAL